MGLTPIWTFTSPPRSLAYDLYNRMVSEIDVDDPAAVDEWITNHRGEYDALQAQIADDAARARYILSHDGQLPSR